uniref:Uncharacterized protein n=1 Tax=Solanum tuberosum TaxID=4113 RepID=M1DYW4_SOLTU
MTWTAIGTTQLDWEFCKTRRVKISIGDSLNSSENRLSLDPRTDPRSVGQTTVRGLCLWIEAPFTQPLTRMMANQHGPSFDLRQASLQDISMLGSSGAKDVATPGTDAQTVRVLIAETPSTDAHIEGVVDMQTSPRLSLEG